MDDQTEAASSSNQDPARWLHRYGDYLFGYALRRLSDPALAEDLVQETLLAAFKAKETFSGRSSEKTWLTGILKHKIIDHIRRESRETPVEDIVAVSDATDDQAIDGMFDARGHWIRPPRDWGDPDKVLHNRQFLDSFERCLARLKPAEARAFGLREFDGCSTEEICGTLKISAGNCGVILYRARMALRRCLETEWFGGE